MRMLLSALLVMAWLPASAQVLNQSGSSTPSHANGQTWSQSGASMPASGTSRLDQTAPLDAAPWAQEYPNAMGVAGTGSGTTLGAVYAGKFCTTDYSGLNLVGGSAAQCVYASSWRTSTCSCGGYTQSRNVHSVSLSTGGASDYVETQGACSACPTYTGVDGYAADEDARAAAAAAAAAAAEAQRQAAAAAAAQAAQQAAAQAAADQAAADQAYWAGVAAQQAANQAAQDQANAAAAAAQQQAADAAAAQQASAANPYIWNDTSYHCTISGGCTGWTRPPPVYTGPACTGDACY